jgi:hypothetical protein
VETDWNAIDQAFEMNRSLMQSRSKRMEKKVEQDRLLMVCYAQFKLRFLKWCT